MIANTCSKEHDFHRGSYCFSILNRFILRFFFAWKQLFDPKLCISFVAREANIFSFIPDLNLVPFIVWQQYNWSLCYFIISSVFFFLLKLDSIQMPHLVKINQIEQTVFSRNIHSVDRSIRKAWLCAQRMYAFRASKSCNIIVVLVCATFPLCTFRQWSIEA
jgi:hypothetical protein